MDIYESSCKDIAAVVLEDSDLRVTVLPDFGGKIASLYSKRCSCEFLVQNPGLSYRKSRYADRYTDGECSGFDDMFPTIDPCWYEFYPWEGVHLPDHGEVWSLKWNLDRSFDPHAGVTLAVQGIRLPYRLRKNVRLTGGGRLEVRYTLTNLSPFPLRCLYSAHIMVSIVPGTRILLPPEAKEGQAVFSRSGRIGGYGDTFSWPCPLQEGDPLDLSRSAECADMEKYYIRGRLPENWCRLQYPDGRIFSVTADSSVPYLGLLLNEGGWNNDGTWDSLYNIFIEPSTAPFDRVDAAALRGACMLLEPEGSRSWVIAAEAGMSGK